jgi:hypothetical protein
MTYTKLLAPLIFVLTSDCYGARCDRITDFSDRIRLEFSDAKLVGLGNFDGRFQLINDGDRAISIWFVGVEAESYHVPDRDYEYQFPDINLHWVTATKVVSTIISPQRKTIPPRTRVTLSVPLPPSETINRTGGEGRLLVHLATPSVCIVSTEFVAMPVRPSVAGFEKKR